MTNRPEPTPDVAARRGVPWADGQITLRVRGPGAEPGRIVRLGRPFALIGRHPGADVRIPDRAAAPRHALLVLDRRGLFCVDLLTRGGTRFAGREFAATWLGVGDSIEVAGRRLDVLRLRADGFAIDPVPGDDDPFAPAGPDLARVSLRPVDDAHPPWVLGSALAFLGRSPACGLRLRGSAASPIHCAIWREPTSVHVIDLLGRSTRVNGRPVEGSARLDDGDTLRVGLAQFAIGIESIAASGLPARIDDATMPAVAMPEATPPALPGPPSEPDLADILAFLRQFQGDAATLIEGQFDQIDSLRRELSALRDDLRADSPPPEVHLPFDLEVPSTRPDHAADGSAAWMLDRINGLEPGSRSRWRDLLGRIAAAITPRPVAPPAIADPPSISPPDSAPKVDPS